MIKLSPWTDRVKTDGFACCGRHAESRHADWVAADTARRDVERRRRIQQIRDTHVASVKESFLHEYELLCDKYKITFFIDGDTSYESPWLEVGYRDD